MIQKEGYTIVDKRVASDKEFADARDESLLLVEEAINFAILSNANYTTCKAPGKLIQRWKKEGKFKHLDKLNLKSSPHFYIKYIGK